MRHSAFSSGSAMVFSAARRAGIGSVMRFSVVDVSHDRSGGAGSVANYLSLTQILDLTAGRAAGSAPEPRISQTSPMRSAGVIRSGLRALGRLAGRARQDVAASGLSAILAGESAFMGLDSASPEGRNSRYSCYPRFADGQWREFKKAGHCCRQILPRGRGPSMTVVVSRCRRGRACSWCAFRLASR